MNVTTDLIDPAVLYGDETLAAFLKVVDPWLDRRYDALLREREHLPRAWEIRSRMGLSALGDDDRRRLEGELAPLVADQATLRAPAHPVLRPTGPLRLPTTASCVGLDSGYFQWQRSSGTVAGLFHEGLLSEPDEFSTIVPTDSPRTLDARVALGANTATLTAVTTVGTTAWVRLGRAGMVTLNAEVFFNAKDVVFTALFGGGEGRLTIGAFVSQVLNLGDVRVGSRWLPVFAEVPRAARELSLADHVYESADFFDFQSRTLGLEFPGEVGEVFACSVFAEAFATTTGACWATVDFAGVVDPIEICQ